MLLAAAVTSNAADCPPSATAVSDVPSFSDDALLDEDIDLEMDSMEATKDGEWRLNGEVTVTQGQRRLKTRDATYDPTSQSFSSENGVEYADPNLVVRGAGAHIDPDGGAQFNGAEFELPGVGGRGGAEKIVANAQGEVRLDDVRYTTCPLGNEDWVLKASDIDIHQRAGFGTGRGVRLDFKGVPILYTPFISFPVGNQRKSGFLFPSLGTSSSSGSSLGVPWYWNIAPNYDATFLPTWYTRRGFRLDTEARFLTETSRGQFDVAYLPSDQEYLNGTERSLLHFVEQSELTERVRLSIDAANASDDRWFEDFGLGPEGTSVTYLNRLLSLTYLDDHWLATARAQNFQTIDDIGIAPEDRPHTLLPQLAVRGSWPQQPFGLTYGVDLEGASFEHNVASVQTGWRADVQPEIRMPLRGAGLYLEPSAAWRYTTYKVDDVAPGEDETLSRSLPIFSVDGGMIFERPSGSRQQRLLTIEPRFMYLYVPYRDQSNLPLFDTGAADLNLVQLFRTNRYVGADRLSDANQLTIGFTSRLLDFDTGRQFLSATIGQAYYFDEPRVTLPGEVLDDTESSDIVGELDLTAFSDWTVGMGLQWDPGETRSEKGDLHFQYQPAHDRVVNLGYRFRRDNIEQVDGSIAWPVGKNWSVYGRLVYSLEDQQELDQFAGFEYRSCCWRLRLVGRRYVSDRTGELDTSVMLQLELNGLSSVGMGADAFLERSIRGYSLRSPER